MSPRLVWWPLPSLFTCSGRNSPGQSTEENCGHGKNTHRHRRGHALTASLTAQDKKPAGSLTDVTGVWVMQVASHQIGLELEQKGTVVEGVMLSIGR